MAEKPDGRIVRYWLTVQTFDFFERLVGLLCWADIEALLQAFPELAPGFTNRTMRKMGELCKPTLRQIYTFPTWAELADRLALWHWTSHSRAMQGRPYLVYDRPCDAVRRSLILPLNRPRHYKACKFLPLSAPEPFGGGLVVINEQPRTANFYAVDDQGFYPCAMDLLCTFDTDRIVVSPLGSAVLLIAENRGEVIVVLLSEYRLERIFSRITCTGLGGSSWFTSEDEFVLSDCNLDLYRYTVDRSEMVLRKEMIHMTELTCPVYYNGVVGKQVNPVGSRSGVPHRVPRYACGKDFVVFEDRCRALWREQMNHPTHAFRLVPSPSLTGEARVLRCHLPRHILLELVVDPLQSLVYVVCLTMENEDKFFKTPRALLGQKLPYRRSCIATFPSYHPCSLCVYVVTVENIPEEGVPSLPLVPTFFMPSRLADRTGSPPDTSDNALFFRHLNLYSAASYSASLSDLFLVVRHSPTTLLLFPRLCGVGSVPLSLTFDAGFSHYDFSPGNLYLCCLPSGKRDEVASAVRLHCLCNHRRAAINKKSTRYARVSVRLTKIDFF